MSYHRNDFVERYFDVQWTIWGILFVIACIIFAGQTVGIIPSTANATQAPTLTPARLIQKITIAPTLLPRSIEDVQRDLAKGWITPILRGPIIEGGYVFAPDLRLYDYLVGVSLVGDQLDVIEAQIEPRGRFALNEPLLAGDYKLVARFEVPDAKSGRRVELRKEETFFILNMVWPHERSNKTVSLFRCPNDQLPWQELEPGALIFVRSWTVQGETTWLGVLTARGYQPISGWVRGHDTNVRYSELKPEFLSDSCEFSPS